MSTRVRHASRRHCIAAALAFVSLGSASCDDSDSGSGPTPQPPGSFGPTRACLPGYVASCDCGAGIVGISTCDMAGLTMSACECPAGAPVAGGVAGVAGTAGAAGMPGAAGAPAAGVPAAGAAGTAPPVTPAEPEAPPPDPRARDIRIAEIAMFQAVKVSLAQGGEPVVARNAPVVVGKEAFVRVYVETLPGYVPRDLEVRLTLSSAEAAVESQSQTLRIDGDSSEPELESSVNFDIPAGTITADLLYGVELREVDPATATGTIDPAARFPEEEGVLTELGARDAGPLRVMIVPYRYQTDGSGRLPVMDDEQLQLFRDYIYAYYPIVDVEFEMHDPVDYTATVGPQTGWESWLDYHCTLRTNEAPDPKLLYYGLMAPRTDARAYGGGVVGISYLPGPAANFGRCSVGVGFEGGIAASTMAHELGHSLGLPHAPCGVDGGPFPYPEARIGSWGFGLSSRTLKAPDEYYDLMSYCDPVFISDYNFQKLFERIRYLNLQFDVLDPSSVMQHYVRVLQTTDGTRSVTGELATRREPGGPEEERAIQLFDAAGRPLGATTGYFFPSSEAGSGLWLVPDDGATEAALDGTGRVRLR